MSAGQPAISSVLPVLKHLKRPRACVDCKESKVRCKRDEGSPGDPCERCVQGGRSCIVSASARNKRPRTKISTVASLESKVDALVAALKEKQAEEAGENGIRSLENGSSESNAKMGLQNEREGSRDGFLKNGQVGNSTVPIKDDPRTRAKGLQPENQYSFTFFLPRPLSIDIDYTDDVVDKGLISLVEAEECFMRFIELMLPHFPIVVFPSSARFSNMRRTRPILCHAILGAASGHLGDGMRRKLMEEVTKIYADRIIMNGERNLDLVQAIQVSAIWYFPPERFDDVRVYQFIHIASTMAIELDFTRIARPSISRPSVRTLPMNTAPKEPQADYQRALICCYILCGLSSMITRRRILMQWTPYLNECLEALEKIGSPKTTDLFLCQWARSQQIAEEAGRHLSMDDPSANIDMHDLTMQYTLQAYERQFDRWKENIPPELLSPAAALDMEASIVNLYLHENFLLDIHILNKSTRTLSRENPVPVDAAQLQSISLFHYKAISICLVSVKKVLDIFLSYSTETLCFVPVFQYVRTAYAAFAMMKISFAASQLDSDLHKVIDRDLNVEFYINELLKSLQEVSRTKKLRAAAIFRLILLMLRTWFQRRKAQVEPDRVHISRGDTILHTVLRTASAINDDGGSTVIDAINAATSYETQALPANNIAAGGEIWPFQRDEEMLNWNELDFESFLQRDDSLFLEAALESLGALVG